MSWEFQDHLPIYAQLMDTLKRRIITGRYLPGEKLPSVRELAVSLAINPNTIQRAYHELESEGYIVSVPGTGINPNTVQRAFSELEREGLIYTQRATGKYVTENADEIKSARQALAKTQVAEFLSNMQSLGYSVGDVIVLLQSFNESEEESSHADSGM